MTTTFRKKVTNAIEAYITLDREHRRYALAISGICFFIAIAGTYQVLDKYDNLLIPGGFFDVEACSYIIKPFKYQLWLIVAYSVQIFGMHLHKYVGILSRLVSVALCFVVFGVWLSRPLHLVGAETGIFVWTAPFLTRILFCGLVLQFSFELSLALCALVNSQTSKMR